MTPDKLRKKWEAESGIPVLNSQEEIDIEYVMWLENRLIELM